MMRAGAWSRRWLAAHTAGVYLLLYAPMAVLVIFSFNRADPVGLSRQQGLWGGFTFDWYVKLAGNQAMLESIRNSLLIGGITTLLCLLIGIPAGIALGRGRLGAKTAASTEGLVYLPLVIPEIVLGVGLLSLFSLVRWRLGIDTVVAAHVVFCVSYVVILIRARMAGLDGTLEQAAADLGAPPGAVFWRVTLPQLAPSVLAAALLVFTLSLDDFLITSFVAGVGSTTLPLQIYSMVKVHVTPEVNAVSSLLLLFTTLTILLAQRLMKNRNDEFRHWSSGVSPCDGQR